jgi:hypothetical protein
MQSMADINQSHDEKCAVLYVQHLLSFQSHNHVVVLSLLEVLARKARVQINRVSHFRAQKGKEHVVVAM